MAIQNEADDEDIEHFEDAPDDTENSPDTEANMPISNNSDKEGTNSKLDSDDEQTNSKLDSDDDSAQEEEASSASSDEDVSGDDEDLLMKKNVEKPQESNSSKLSVDNGNRRESLTKHSLPGGYDPRHREPSFWYVSATYPNSYMSYTGNCFCHIWWISLGSPPISIPSGKNEKPS